MATEHKDDPLILLIGELAREFPEATAVELSEACAVPVSKVEIALGQLVGIAYRAKLVAKIRAHLAEEDA